MSDKEWRQMLQEQRLKHQLEIQSRQIEKVFSRHEVPAQVEGGSVQSRFITFDLREHLENGIDRIKDLTSELRKTLGVPTVSIRREGGQLRLMVAKRESPPVPLLDLMAILPDLPPATAVLGLADEGSPVLLDFNDKEVTHVLVCGGSGAGKTSLLRTIALSLAIANRQSRIQLLIIDPYTVRAEPSYAELEPLTFLPHMMSNVCHHVDEAAEVLAFLVNEMEYRLEQELETPAMIVLVDNADGLFEQGGAPIVERVTRLLQRGQLAGIHLILSASRPDNQLDEILNANLPVRIVGQLPDSQLAAAAVGIGGTGAEHLLGQGDLLAVVNLSRPVHFQAAYIGDYDLHLSLEELHRRRPRPVLARTVDIRTSLPKQEEFTSEQPSGGRPFTYDGDDVDVVL